MKSLSMLLAGEMLLLKMSMTQSAFLHNTGLSLLSPVEVDSSKRLNSAVSRRINQSYAPITTVPSGSIWDKAQTSEGQGKKSIYGTLRLYAHKNSDSDAPYPFSKRSLPEKSLLFKPRLNPNSDYDNKKDECTAMVMIPGAGFQPSQYQRLAEEIQDAMSHPMWIVIPDLPFKAANPSSTRVLVQQSIDALKRAGYAGDQVILAGHSLGAIFLPQALPNCVDEKAVAGLIFFGSYTMRADRENSLAARLPTLTVSGELDGLIAPTRIAEDYYQAITKNASTEDSKLQHAIVIIEGMNHMQYATGESKDAVKAYDLEPEISDTQAQQTVARSVADFIETHQFNNMTSQIALIDTVNRTEAFLKPLITALSLEGSYHLNEPCHLADEGQECMLGSPWAEWAQTEIADIEGVDYNIEDEFHNSWTINVFTSPHFYHPYITSIDEPKDSGRLTIQMTTISEPVYDKLDSFDNSFFSNTAKEIRTKFNSRQAILNALGNKLSFEKATRPNTCGRVNAKTISWAINNAPEKVRQRYLDKGIQLVSGSDIEKSNGPAWIWSYLEFNKQITDDGQEQRVLNSPTMVTPLNHPVPLSGGKHYCKLLSPARALAWIYTDSLRKNDPFNLN